MRKIYSILLLFFIPFIAVAQHIGINQPNPTHSLHVSPVTLGDDPLRIEGVQTYSIGDTALLMLNPTTGVVKYINPADFVALISGGSGLGTDDQNLDSLILDGLTLTTFIENGSSASVDLTPITDSITSLLYNNADTLLNSSTFINDLRDSIDTDVDSVTLVGTTLTIYENGSGVFVDLSSLSDADSDPENEIQDLS